MIINPFHFESPSDSWSFTDRDELLPELARMMGERGRRVLLHGRRRMGKTSLLRRAAERSRFPCLFCDLTTAAHLGELARRLLEAAPQEKGARMAKVLELAARHLKSVVVTAGKLSLSGELRLGEEDASLEGVLNLLDERAALADEPWTIILDEFQEIRALGGERADWRLRGIIQPHRNLNYVFTGSDHRITEWMTAPQAPFFKQLTQIEVGPIDAAHLAGWVNERAGRGGLPGFAHGAEIVALAGPCTGDVIRLAKEVFDHVAAKAGSDLVARAFDRLSLVELHHEFAAHWRVLPLSQRGLLRAIASGFQPTAAATLSRFGLRASSSAATALEALVEKQLILRTAQGVAFDSPFLRRWVEFNAQGAGDDEFRVEETHGPRKAAALKPRATRRRV